MILYEVYLHLRDKVYPCLRQRIARYSFIIFATIFIGFELLKRVFAFHLSLTLDTVIILILFFILYILLYCKIYKHFGITFLCKVDFNKYAEYVAANYWKNIQYEVDHNLLEILLAEAKNKETNVLFEILEKITKKIQNKYQKKYVIDCIFSICDSGNILLIMEKYLIPLMEEDINVIYFLIEKTHIWSMNHRNPENILLYLCLLKEFDQKTDYEKIVIYNLVNFIKNDYEYRQKLSDLQIEGKCEFLKSRHIHRIEEYVIAENKIKKAVERDYKKKGESLSFSSSPSRKDAP